MKFVTLLFIFLARCSAFDVPKIEISTKFQPPKRLMDGDTLLKFHYVLRCPNRKFSYLIRFFESDVVDDDFRGYYMERNVTSETYNLYESQERTDATHRFEFTVYVRHTCKGQYQEEMFYETMKCPIEQEECEFYFDVDLVTLMMRRPRCNEDGTCNVIVSK